MLAAVLIVFGASLVAPGVARLGARAAGWVLGLVPLGLFVYFARQLPAVAGGAVQAERHAWMPGMGVDFAFYLDGLSLLFALLVTGIGALIVVYAGAYMDGHDEIGRFFAQLLLFMGAMLGLVLADNLIVFFIFFELTSLASYLLIGFYHEEEEARRAARQALIVTGTGGLALLGGLVLLEQATGALTFSELLAAGEGVRAHALYPAILVLVLAGAFTKSAQFPFHFWLPAAMAGPTPVSAYLHSATMVKAGVFLLARLHPVLGGTPAWRWTLGLVGGFTMLLTAWLALRYTDLKQILAYTTTMVLGLLVMLLGLGTEGAVKAAIVFTLVHAFYKGALFMVAGSVDHATGTRDVGELGGLWKKMPMTAAGGLLAALSMGGVPLFFGFIGKEAVYEAVLHAGALGYGLAAAAVLANAALFAAALVVGLKPFFGEARKALMREAHEGHAGLWLGPMVLAAGGVALGLLPGLADGLVGAASASVLGEAHSVHLKIWHGLTPALGLSALTFALGGVLYALWTRLQPSAFVHGLSRTLGQGPSAAFERGLYETARTGYGVTGVLQSGNVRAYLGTVLATLALVVGGALLSQGGLAWPALSIMPRYYELSLAALVVIGAVAAVRAESRFVAILALSVGGYSVAMIYLLFGAPDLAMTQFAIETLSMILLVLVLHALPRLRFDQTRRGSVRDALIATGAGAVMTMVMLAALARPLDRYISYYLASNSYTEAKGYNIVNVILVDYRALDTLGEITVLTMAGLGVYALMRVRPSAVPSEGEDEETSDGLGPATERRRATPLHPEREETA